jgi:hypothetical protein
MREGDYFRETLLFAASEPVKARCSRRMRFVMVEDARETPTVRIAELLQCSRDTVERERRRTRRRLRDGVPVCCCGCGLPLPDVRRDSKQFLWDSHRARFWREQRKRTLIAAVSDGEAIPLCDELPLGF